MHKRMMTALALSALAVIGTACSRQGEARENYRDTTNTVVPDTAMNRDTTLRDTMMGRDSLRTTPRTTPPRDTTPARRP